VYFADVLATILLLFSVASGYWISDSKSRDPVSEKTIQVRQLKQQPHERGRGDVQRARERPCALDVRLADANVQASVESLHGSP
jgi:hypothetical protein